MPEPVVPTDPAAPTTLPAEGSTTTTPPVDNGSETLEQARKDAEKAQMRANQLQKELDRKNKADEDAEHKRLEENQEYKTLAEKYQAELEEERRTRESSEKQAEIDKGTAEILSKYPGNVKEIAATAGLSLNDTTEDAKTALATKLDEIAKRVGTTAPVTPNNPNPASPEAGTDREKAVQKMRFNNVSNKFHDTAFRGAIRNLDTVKAMKEQSGFSPENI